MTMGIAAKFETRPSVAIGLATRGKDGEKRPIEIRFSKAKRNSMIATRRTQIADSPALESKHDCCGPKQKRGELDSQIKSMSQPYRSGLIRPDAVSIPGGRAEIGTDEPILSDDGEGPHRSVVIRPFAIDAVTVTNERFAAFVDDTGYLTEAERLGWSFVFFHHLAGAERSLRVQGAEWWCRVDGACWSAPEGPGSELVGRQDHPVVHVSYSDAQQFALWSGGRLPSEVEWEHAARGGLTGKRFPWGDKEPDEEAFFPCNIWQGDFPNLNTCADGYGSTAPVRSFAANGYGLYNCSGNVWEWCADAFRISSLKRTARSINKTALRNGWRVLKGGSFLCHRSYCYRYRIVARTGNPVDTSTSHIGFRLAYDL